MKEHVGLMRGLNGKDEEKGNERRRIHRLAHDSRHAHVHRLSAVRDLSIEGIGRPDDRPADLIPNKDSHVCASPCL